MKMPGQSFFLKGHSLDLPRIFFAGVFLLSLCLFFWGLRVPPSLGDEIHHYRFAKNCFFAGGRALYDSIYASSSSPGFFYDTEVAWPFFLSLIWRLLGRVSFPAAQLYQTFYYFLLVTGTYRVSRILYGVREGILSALVVATAPMIVSFSILFYLDMPAAAVSVWIFCFLLERRYLGAGILLGTGYLVKKSLSFFIPAIFLWILIQNWKQWGHWILSNLKVFIPAGLAEFTDDVWRRRHFVSQSVSFSKEWVLQRMSAFKKFEASPSVSLPVSEKMSGGITALKPLPVHAMKTPAIISDFSNSSIFNPLDAAKYFGLFILIGLAIYFLTRRWEKKDGPLWMFILFFAASAGALHLFPDIRYLIPVVPFLSILAARGLWRFLGTSPAKLIVGVLCALQFAAPAVYTLQQRSIPEEIQADRSVVIRSI